MYPSIGAAYFDLTKYSQEPFSGAFDIKSTPCDNRI